MEDHSQVGFALGCRGVHGMEVAGLEVGRDWGGVVEGGAP